MDLLQGVLDVTFLNSLNYFFFLGMKVICGILILSNQEFIFCFLIITAFCCHSSEIDLWEP